jgi:predicted nucleic acid-binding protein
LRDTLLRAAAEDLYQVRWSEQILNEVRRNLVSSLTITEPQAKRLISTMQRAFPEAMVTGHEPLIETMPNQEKDRHVAAAAVEAGAHLIVTSNLKDFRELPEGIGARSPDDFLCDLFEAAPEAMAEIVKDQAAALKRPPVSLSELLVGLEKTVPRFVRAFRDRVGNE